MSQVPEFTDGPVVNARTMPPMTWNGSLVGPLETATHYLHLTAFPCQQCNGPVIAASLGTRHDNITQGNRHPHGGGNLYRVREQARSHSPFFCRPRFSPGRMAVDHQTARASVRFRCLCVLLGKFLFWVSVR